MTFTTLALLVVLGQAPAVDPLELVKTLGASRYADRQEASTALELLGRRALPALQGARDLKDPEIQARAAALINKIEGSLLTAPTLVSLDFTNQLVSAAVKSFGEQAGVKLALIPENSPNWNTRRLTLREPAALPFWKALDRLCEAGRLQYNAAQNGFNGGREPMIPLFEGDARSTAPTFDSGPFRVSVVGLHFQRDVSFPQSMPTFPGAAGRPEQPGVNPQPALNEQFFAQVQVAGEPRLALSQAGALRILEAVDDKGQALVVPQSALPSPNRAPSYFGFATGSMIQLQASMIRPPDPGKIIKILKGVIPLNVATRKPNPLVVAITGASGRTFQNDDVALTVHEIRPQAENHPASIEITVRTGPRAASASPGSVVSGEFAMARPDSLQQQIEIADLNGRAIPWYQTSFDPEAGRITLTLTSPEQAPAPSEIRYYSLVRAATEVSFQFTNVPLP